MNIWVEIFGQTYVFYFFWANIQEWNSESYDKYVFHSMRNNQNVLWSGQTILHSP